MPNYNLNTFWIELCLRAINDILLFSEQSQQFCQKLKFLHMSLTKYSGKYSGKIFEYPNIFGMNIKLEYEYEYIWTFRIAVHI